MTLIVAEIGVNWNGDLQLADELIRKSKEIGCDAVKFQAFNHEIVRNHPEKELLLHCSITERNIESIDAITKNVGIEWFCTPMYPDAVDLLEPFVKRFKIREIDGRLLLENKMSKLIEKILNTKKEVFVSSRKSPKECEFFLNEKIKWLYCVPKYPCNLEDLDFTMIKNFDGYSNHCNNIMAPLTAVILGTKIIEIHITKDKNQKFFDNNVSFDYNEFREFVKLCRMVDKIKR